MQQRLYLGVFLALVATLFYSSLTALNKAYASSIPLPMMVFIQTTVALICFLPILFRHSFKNRSQSNPLKTNRIWLYLLRASLSLGISYFLFSAVRYIPLTNAVLLANTAPLIVPFIAYLFLSQKINHHMWMPIFIGFVGIAFVLQPDGKIFDIASFLAIGAAVCVATSILCVRRLAITESTEAITFYYFLIATIISGLIATQCWVSLPSEIWVILIIGGVLFFLSQYSMTYALKFINAQLVSTLLYMNVINSAVISWFFWDLIPNSSTVIGIALTILGGILCIRAEHQYTKRIASGAQYVEERA